MIEDFIQATITEMEMRACVSGIFLSPLSRTCCMEMNIHEC